MNHLQLAFVIGLFGSLHCVGMCGPLAFAIPNEGSHKWKWVLSKFLYQAGRAVSYAILGFLVGMLGKHLWIAGFQQALSLLSGIIIVVYAVSGLLPVKQKLNINFSLINQGIAMAMKRRAGHFIIGMLNGILPCAFVYVALATAINTNSAYQSALFMFFFGLGTLPLMFAAAVGIGFLNHRIRKSINKVLPVLSLVLGLWFVIRGLALDIPFLSPVISSGSVICK